jgi:hypothetical protein
VVITPISIDGQIPTNSICGFSVHQIENMKIPLGSKFWLFTKLSSCRSKRLVISSHGGLGRSSVELVAIRNPTKIRYFCRHGEKLTGFSLLYRAYANKFTVIEEKSTQTFNYMLTYDNKTSTKECDDLIKEFDVDIVTLRKPPSQLVPFKELIQFLDSQYEIIDAAHCQ